MKIIKTKYLIIISIIFILLITFKRNWVTTTIAYISKDVLPRIYTPVALTEIRYIKFTETIDIVTNFPSLKGTVISPYSISIITNSTFPRSSAVLSYSIEYPGDETLMIDWLGSNGVAKLSLIQNNLEDTDCCILQVLTNAMVFYYLPPIILSRTPGVLYIENDYGYKKCLNIFKELQHISGKWYVSRNAVWIRTKKQKRRPIPRSLIDMSTRIPKSMAVKQEKVNH